MIVACLHQACKQASSKNSLLCKVSLILLSDAELLEPLHFLSLDSLDLETLVLKSLSNHGTFLQVIKTLLLLDFGVHANLVPMTRNMTNEHL